MLINLLLGLLSRGFVYEAENGAGSRQAPGAEAAGKTAGDQGSTQTGAAQGASQDTGTTPPLVDVTAVDAQGRRLWYSGEDYGKVHQEAAQWRTKFQKLKERLATVDPDESQAAEAENTDTATAAPQVEALSAQLRTLQIQNAVLAEAARQRDDRAAFVDPDDVVRLIDSSAISVGEDGTITGVQEAVAALAAKKPHLLRRADAVTQVQRVNNPARQDTLTMDAIDHMTPREIIARQAEVDRVLAEAHASRKTT